MPTPIHSHLVSRHEIVEGNPWPFLADVIDPAVGRIFAADIASIAWTVLDVSDDVTTPTETGSGTFVVADVWFDTNRTDGGWPASDTAGYNFAAEIPADPFLQTRNIVGQFRVEILVTTQSGAKYWAIVALLDVVPAFSREPAA